MGFGRPLLHAPYPRSAAIRTLVAPSQLVCYYCAQFCTHFMFIVTDGLPFWIQR
jgi:hypothetical protein